MPKTIHRSEYGILLQLLKERRSQAGLTQTECSEALGRSQSFMSDVERGVRRLDLVELRDLCAVLKISLEDFVRDFERALSRRRHRT